LQKFSFSLLLALVVSIGISFIDGVNYECERLSENVIRLHVIANSDSALDQNLKLKVRDRVLEFDFLNNLTNKQSAKQVLEENLDFIRKTKI
jgi:stage II sporulation protein R